MIHCPTCDAGLRFEIETQQMVCDHCDNHFNVKDVGDSEKHDAKGRQLIDLYVFTCPECGAELAVDDKNDAVGFCPYCGGESMLFDRVRKDWVPDGIIPFKVTKEQCRQAYVEEVRKRPFVSKKYRDPKLIDSFRGIYMPYWQFVGEQKTPYAVSGTEVVDGHKASTKIRRTYEQWYEPNYRITGLSHDASAGFDDHTSELLAPYSEDATRPFHPGYLSGFYAEISDMDQEEYKQYAIARCQDLTANQLDVPITNQEKRRIETEISALKNVMYPVWFMSYRRGNKISYAAVNGETGRVAADLPLSPLKIIGAAIALAAVLFALFSLTMGVLPSVKAPDVLSLCAVLAFASTCLLTDSQYSTVEQSLRMENEPQVNAKNKLSRGTISTSGGVLVALASFLGIYFMAIDGSYDGLLRMCGIFISLYGCGFLALWGFLQGRGDRKRKERLSAARSSQLENGIVKAYMRYRIPFNILRIILLVICAIALFCGLTELLGKFECYALCVIVALGVVMYAVLQIAFQIKISERKPPQMSKEGALYDAD